MSTVHVSVALCVQCARMSYVSAIWRFKARGNKVVYWYRGMMRDNHVKLIELNRWLNALQITRLLDANPLKQHYDQLQWYMVIYA